MRKIIALITVLILVFSICACTSETESKPEKEEETAEKAAHTIAVLVYDYYDDEVASFRRYLQDYVGKEFDVNFLYSESISSPEAALDFISRAADFGAEGVMSFNTYDLKKEVELCEDKGIYFMLGSGTVKESAFKSVEDNEYFLGVIGPGDENEYMAGFNLAENVILKDMKGGSFCILSGGGALGNEMHRLRTKGIIEKLENAYGIKFDMTSDEIAETDEVIRLDAGDISICVAPGYFTNESDLKAAEEVLKGGSYDYVLSVLPATKLMDDIKGTKLGVIDCYSENNLRYFTSGDLDYVTGKYSSLIGPSFAAMYNAVTGHADVFRDNGKAFRIRQGFWSSDNREDYEEKYSIASSLEKCAYNYEDIQSVLTDYNENASLEDLKELAEAYRYEDAVKRRG